MTWKLLRYLAQASTLVQQLGKTDKHFMKIDVLALIKSLGIGASRDRFNNGFSGDGQHETGGLRPGSQLG